MDENGMPVRDNEPRSDATFSNLHPDTSEAEALGGQSTLFVWGTNVSIGDSVSAFRSFLYNYAKKYRMWADGSTEEDTRALGTQAEEKEYMTILSNMLKLGVTGLNLDIRNMKAYPATLKLWHHLQTYPQEIVPLMDQALRDVMVDIAEKEMDILKQQASQRFHAPALRDSSVPPAPSSEIGNQAGQGQPIEIPNLVAEVDSKTYKVLPFGLDKTVNMRDLDPSGMRFGSSKTNY